MTQLKPGYVLVPEKITEAQADVIGMPSIIYEKAVARMSLKFDIPEHLVTDLAVQPPTEQGRPKDNPLRDKKPKIRSLFRKKPGIKGTFA